MSREMPDEVRKLIEEIVAKFPAKDDHLCLGRAALKLDCSPKYLREHLDFFPNAWKFPGAKGEIRIPLQDLRDNAERFRLFRRSTVKKHALPALERVS
jgi:hypothetical protein